MPTIHFVIIAAIFGIAVAIQLLGGPLWLYASFHAAWFLYFFIGSGIHYFKNRKNNTQ